MSLEQIGASLTTLRIPRHVALTVMCALALGPEIRKRADQVLTARIARGLTGHRNKLAALKNVAGTLMPIVAWGFRSAVIRSEYWTQRNLLDSPELQRRAPIVFVDWLYVGLIAFACVLVVFR
jgi:energy-coupling factor transporter transmembrane protein EcfT